MIFSSLLENILWPEQLKFWKCHIMLRRTFIVNIKAAYVD